MIDTAALDATVRRFPVLLNACRSDRHQHWAWWAIQYESLIIAEYRRILKTERRA